MARAKLPDRTAADRALEEFRKIDDGSLNYQFAEVYAQRGEADRAFASLEAALRAADPGLASMRANQLLDPLRRDARFQAAA